MKKLRQEYGFGDVSDISDVNMGYSKKENDSKTALKPQKNALSDGNSSIGIPLLTSLTSLTSGKDVSRIYHGFFANFRIALTC